MNRILTSIFVFLFIGLGFAQNEANIWYFGLNAGLDFNSGTPVTLTNGALNTYEGCASISDNSGNILFYTDGVTVYNKNHVVMSNGFGLAGNTSSTQSAIIVPQPASSTIYWVFTVDDEGGPDGLSYSQVDLTQASGLGAVTGAKNIQLVAPTCEKVTGVMHDNGQDIWVITHLNNSDAFYAYLVTSSGINTTPVVSNVGTFINGGSIAAICQLKTSPDGSRIAIANYYNFNQILDFDNTTGLVSNPVTISGSATNIGPYGCEFSPSGNIVYFSDVSTPMRILQYDLTATNIPASEQVIASGEAVWASMQLGPDGKIYIAVDDSNYLSVIDAPNVLGNGSNFIESGVFLGSGTSTLGLPNYVSSVDLSDTSEIILEIPNVFTPNSDGFNDLFVPVISKGIISMNTTIYNRWGNNIFESNKLLIEWTGQDVSDGTYFWIIYYTDINGNKNNLNGHLIILR